MYIKQFVWLVFLINTKQLQSYKSQTWSFLEKGGKDGTKKPESVPVPRPKEHAIYRTLPTSMVHNILVYYTCYFLAYARSRLERATEHNDAYDDHHNAATCEDGGNVGIEVIARIWYTPL